MSVKSQNKSFVGGGRAVRPSMFEIYQVKDKMGRVAYFTDKDLQKFLNDWNEDYDTDYEDWIEFNEYERESIKDMDPLLDYQIRTIRQSLYTAKDYSTRIKLKHL